MPTINGRFVEFDPEILAHALSQGHEVRAHYNDWEDADTSKNRAQQEWDMVNKILYEKYRDTWEKHNKPQPASPWKEWSEQPTTMNMGVMGKNNIGPQNNIGLLTNFLMQAKRNGWPIS